MQNNLQRQKPSIEKHACIVFTDGKDARAFIWQEQRLQFLQNIFPLSLIEEEINQPPIGRIYTDINGRRRQITVSPRTLLRKERKMIRGISEWLNGEARKKDGFSGFIMVAPADILDRIHAHLTTAAQEKIIVQLDKDKKPYNHAILENDVAQILSTDNR